MKQSEFTGKLFETFSKLVNLCF